MYDVLHNIDVRLSHGETAMKLKADVGKLSLPNDGFRLVLKYLALI